MESLLARYAKVPERLRYPAIALALLALVATFFFAVHAGQQETLAELDEQIDKLEAKRTEKRAFADHLAKYEARLAELQQALLAARALLPDNPDVPQFLAQLGNSARDVGMVVDRFEPRAETYEDFYAEIAFGMDVRGGYHDIASFIDQVGRMDRIVNVSDIAMVQPKVENQKVLVRGNFLVKTYRFISDELAAELEAKKAKKK